MGQEIQNRMRAESNLEKMFRVYAILANQYNVAIINSLTEGDLSYSQIIDYVQQIAGKRMSYADAHTRIGMMEVAGIVTVIHKGYKGRQGIAKDKLGKWLKSDKPTSQIRLNLDAYLEYVKEADRLSQYFKA